MADQTKTRPEARPRESFSKQLSTAAAKRALAPLAAAAATAATAFLLRKGEQLWEKHLLPKLREAGGGQAAVKDALEKAGERLPSVDTLSELSEKVTEKAKPVVQEVADKLPGTGESGSASDADREKERKARQKRRQQRKRTLDKSGST